MPAVASTIFKIRAHSDFIAKTDSSPSILSFRRGQPFYALSADYEKGLYFVSTQFAVPFSRTAVSGLVPIEYFDKVDLLSKDPPIHRKKVVAAPKPAAAANHHNQQLLHHQQSKASKVIVAPSNNTQAHVPPVPRRKQSLATSSSLDPCLMITSVKVMSIQHDASTSSESFCIRVGRKSSTSSALNTIVITRSIPDFIGLAGAAGAVFKSLNQEIYPLSHPSRDAKLKAMELYLTRLSMHLLPSLLLNPPCLPDAGYGLEESQGLLKAAALFFAPRSDMETLAGQTSTLRRDSGADTDDTASASTLDNEKNGGQQQLQQQQHQGQTKSNPFASFSKMVFGSSSSSVNNASVTAAN